MTEKRYNTIWEYTVLHKQNFAEYENPAVAISDALVEEGIVPEPKNTAELRELIECIDSALKFGGETQ